MKKLLGIVILGLLIVSPAFAFNKFMIKQQKRFKNSELVKIPSYRAFDFYAIQEGGDKGKQIFNKNIKFWKENLLN